MPTVPTVALPPEPDAGSRSDTGFRTPLRAIASVCVLAGALWLVDRLLPDVATLTGLGETWLAGDPRLGIAGFVLAGVLLTAVGLPRQSVALTGGYLFGTLVGTLLALVATLGGCIAAYQVARALGAGALAHRLPGVAARLDGWTRERVFAKTLMVRLFPLGSNVATNLVAGAARAPRLPFFAGSLVGFLPQTLVFALVGTSVGTSSLAPLLTGLALLSASTAIAARLYRSGRAHVDG